MYMGFYADSNGTKIYYQIRGKGEPLVLIMGFGATGDVWEKHTVVYEQHFKCIIIDNRGIGKSDQPTGPYTTKMLADDTIAVMDHAGVDKARIAGISMGGAIAQELVLNYPDRVICALLMSTWPKFNNYAKSVYGSLKKLRVTSKPDHFTELIQLWIYASPYFETNLEDLIEGQKNALNDPNPQSREGFEGQLEACVSHDTVSRLHEIDTPVLITVGDLDIFTPPEFSDILHNEIKNSEYVHFEKGGHVHHWEDLERFNRVTTEFLLKN